MGSSPDAAGEILKLIAITCTFAAKILTKAFSTSTVLLSYSGHGTKDLHRISKHPSSSELKAVQNSIVSAQSESPFERS